MSRRSEERAGEEAWRAAADPDAPKPSSRFKGLMIVAITVIAVGLAAFIAWRVFGSR